MRWRLTGGLATPSGLRYQSLNLYSTTCSRSMGSFTNRPGVFEPSGSINEDGECLLVFFVDAKGLATRRTLLPRHSRRGDHVTPDALKIVAPASLFGAS